MGDTAMTVSFTNPKHAGQVALIKIQRTDGEVMTLKAGSNAKRYAKRHQDDVKEAAGTFFAENMSNPMAALFARCKGRIEMHRKINGIGDAVWNQ
jgi:hypothetical protein